MSTDNIQGQIELNIDDKKVTAKDEKIKQKEIVDNTIKMLSIIYDKIQKSKRHDRYIVSDGEKWGVVDSIGNIIIPLKFTRITTSNDKLFRVYGEQSGVKVFIPMVGDMEYKYQSVYDYEGNQLCPMMPYTKTLSIGKYGLLLGFSTTELKVNNQETHLTYIGYDKQIIEFEDNIVQAMVSKYIPEMIFVIGTDLKMRALRVDKKLEVLDLEQAYDSIRQVTGRYKTILECQNDLNIRKNVAEMILRYMVGSPSILYLGKIKGVEYLLEEHYRPILHGDKNDKFKSVFR